MNAYTAATIVNSVGAVSSCATILGLYWMGAGLHCLWGLIIMFFRMQAISSKGMLE